MKALQFYRNEIRCKPDNLTIDEIHAQWYGKDEILERKHGYIQWLFPSEGKSSFNPDAPLLQKGEVRAMAADGGVLARILTSTRMMFAFFGVQINAGEDSVSRGKNYQTAYANIKANQHNLLRMTRIATFLSLFPGKFHELALSFLAHMMAESDLHGLEIGNAVIHWMGVFSHKDSGRMVALANAHKLHAKPTPQRRAVVPEYDRGPVVICCSDIDRGMSGFVIDSAKSNLAKHRDESLVAQAMQKELQTKYQKSWSIFVGRSFGSSLVPDRRRFVFFYVGQMAILAFLAGNITTRSRLSVGAAASPTPLRIGDTKLTASAKKGEGPKLPQRPASTSRTPNTAPARKASSTSYTKIQDMALGDQELVRAVVNHAAWDIITPHCPNPRCKQTVVEFSACFALTCPSCNCHFCAFCMKAHEPDAHPHVAHCKLNKYKPNVFAPSESATEKESMAVFFECRRGVIEKELPEFFAKQDKRIARCAFYVLLPSIDEKLVSPECVMAIQQVLGE